MHLITFSVPQVNQSSDHDYSVYYSCPSSVVARRCVPTVIDIVQQAESVFNFTSNTSLLDLVDRSNITAKDLFLNLDLQSIVDGSL